MVDETKSRQEQVLAMHLLNFFFARPFLTPPCSLPHTTSCLAAPHTTACLLAPSQSLDRTINISLQ